jgi:uncharacterized protein (UPF0332 family)
LAILSPSHLFEQAEKLVAAPPAGPPRQVDLRRAISSAYYGVFHATLTAAADEFVGRTNRSDARYALIYRSIDHRMLKQVCSEAQKQLPSRPFVPYFPKSGLGPHIQAFAAAVINLQEKRNSADYDPLVRFSTADAKLLIEEARTALERFTNADQALRRAFLTFALPSQEAR